MSSDEALELIREYASSQSLPLGKITNSVCLKAGEHAFASEDVWLYIIELSDELQTPGVDPNHYVFLVGLSSRKTWTLQLL